MKKLFTKLLKFRSKEIVTKPLVTILKSNFKTSGNLIPKNNVSWRTRGYNWDYTWACNPNKDITFNEFLLIHNETTGCFDSSIVGIINKTNTLFIATTFKDREDEFGRPILNTLIWIREGETLEEVINTTSPEWAKVFVKNNNHIIEEIL